MLARKHDRLRVHSAACVLAIAFLIGLPLSVAASGAAPLQALPDRVVVLTFDDAAASHATFVAPLLKKYGFGATFFICEYPGFEDKAAYMTWEQIRSLHEMGFEVANHTRTHTHVDKMKKEQLVAELEAIEQKCAAQGIPRPVSFAYPAYATHPAALAVLAERGYLFARVGGSRPYRPDVDSPLLVPSFSTTGTNKDRVIDALKQARSGQVVVLTIHGVPDVAHPQVTTPPELFEEYLRYLSDNKYTVIAMRDLARYVDPVKAREEVAKRAASPAAAEIPAPTASAAFKCEAATANPQANEQLVYFTSTSLLADDRRLIFMSDRTGHPNIFLRDLVGGEERQLTTNTEGVLKSYVYFDGQAYKGFGKASVSVDAARGIVYFLQGRKICAVDTQRRQRVLAEYPEGQMTAFTHVSADGTRLCVPTTDARALDDGTVFKGKPPYNIDARVREENLSSYLRVYDTADGKEVLCERVPQAWITHVQFSPVNRDVILYNHEWPSDCGIRRMWLWDGKAHLRLRTEGDGRSRADWTCHEMWERDGQAIIYHGAYAKGAAYVGRVKTDGTGRVEIALRPDWKRYGHFTEGKPGMLVTDGYYEQPGDPGPKSHGAWISLLKTDWDARQVQWLPLCLNGSSWKSQDAHPHPIFNHAGTAVFFTSDKSGKRAVYRVELPKE